MGSQQPPPQQPPMVPMDKPPQFSELEFEEIMSRNRTVSSSAISRAISDAATGFEKKIIFLIFISDICPINIIHCFMSSIL